MRRIVIAVAFAWVLALPVSAQQDDLETLAENLVELRGEVDQLQSDLDILREEHKSRMAYLSAQASELGANRDREQRRIKQLESELQDLRERQEKAGAAGETLVPVVMAQIDAIEAHVSSGFPFKRQARIGELGEIESRLNSGAITPQRAVNQLWAFVEDEVRIAEENAIYSQTINLDGADVLVDVAKLGSVMLFFRTRDERYGRAVAGANGWRWQVLEGGDQRKRIEALFDSLRKQIRQGEFELPNPIPYRLQNSVEES